MEKEEESRVGGEKMSIESQFNKIAREYDVNRKKFIPCYEEYYEKMTRFICANIEKPKRVLDLGAGTGLLTYYWYREIPSAEYVLIDIADEMLDVSRQRFQGIDSVKHDVMDYTAGLPEEEFDAIISALSIHHLEDAQKEKLFVDIYEKLPQGGIFVNYDQFCGGSQKMNRWFDSYWVDHLYASGLSDEDIALWKERRKLDKECSIEDEVQMLLRSGFSEVKCVYAYQKFGVIVAMK